MLTHQHRHILGKAVAAFAIVINAECSTAG
jgi:hypothetical protein